MKKTLKFLSVLMVICMLLSSCSQSAVEVVEDIQNTNDVADINNISGNASKKENNDANINTPTVNGNSNSGNVMEDLAADNFVSNSNTLAPQKGEYNEGVALVKYDGEMNDNVLSQLDLVSATPLFNGSSWYTVELKADADTVETVNYLRKLDCFDEVDYDYIMKADAEVESVDISSNTYADKLTYLETMGVKKGWESNLNNGKTPGGSPDVIIAIIDTGVDYNHLDLRNNIWVNPAEIPDNGIDDDGNGYVDDIHGWDCVGDDNDPMDDNGHGTHVAGIAAAEHNKIGTVGVAYNCKIMVLKAGNSSGYFNNSDIAEAVQYAYMNGASVINMSFGGSNISFAVEEALENAYNQCVLVAAAGNRGICNEPECLEHILQPPMPCYPASLTYVIGVMSCNSSGTVISSFSNFDHYAYNKYEYEVYAPGEQIQSTWPNNKYASLSGTSMAAPTVAGIAAVLRSTYPDRDVYSNKYIQSQIVNTGTKSIMTHTVADLYEALTRIPTPSVNLYDYYIFDNVEFSNKNNGDGIIDAGETIHLAIELQNRGGVASNVVATLDTIRNDDSSLTDPYFDIIRSSITLSDIGTYSVRDCEKIYNDDHVVGTVYYFEIVVREDCPNAYISNFNINITYSNGMYTNDTTEYSNAEKAQLSIRNGVKLPTRIVEDTVFSGDKRYILSSSLYIARDVTVVFEAGAIIQFYEDTQAYYDTLYNSPTITNQGGTLIFNGTDDNLIHIGPSERFFDSPCVIYSWGQTIFNYCDMENVYVQRSDYATNSGVEINYSTISYLNPNMYKYQEGKKVFCSNELYFGATSINNSVLKLNNYAGYYFNVNIISNCLIEIGSAGSYIDRHTIYAENSVFYILESEKLTPNLYGTNSVFMQELNSTSAKHYAPVSNHAGSGNKFYGMYASHPDVFFDNYYEFDINDTTNQDLSLVYPYITNIHLENLEGETITKCGTEQIKVIVDFNRDMDTTMATKLYFGSIEPYADYEIVGEYVNSRQWVGYYTLKANIENGEQRFRLVNAQTAGENPLQCLNNATMYSFTIDTTAAMSMNLQAVAQENGIELTFAQDDYDTLLGYNIYRADSKDGNYVKLNPAILLPSDSTFLDENAEPGKTYWYTYTVVLTDFTESNPAGKVVATAMDTLAPNMYHTPVNQGYMNNNLVISCTASDNVAISTVMLYYRAVGTTEWKSLNMAKQSDKYSATIFGSDLTLDGIEYYIVATDGRNTINKGSAETPYTVVIKDASSISRIGDVDGNGTVTAMDALMLMRCLEGSLILSDDEFKRADLNGDGVLSAAEALRILQYVNGKVNTLEM